MKPKERFLNQPKKFWAHIRSLSQSLGYSVRGEDKIHFFTAEEIKHGMAKNGLSSSHLFDKNGNANAFCTTIVDYFTYRADVINNFVKKHLMDKKESEELFQSLYKKLNPKCPLPMNKQKGDKKAVAFLTCIINMLIEKHSGTCTVDYDPRQLTTITKNGMPLRTLARRIDGAFPSVVNPIAVWEIKEYYYTTTFGSRVADGVYETLLDGLELEELKKEENIHILHYLFVDDRFTWWDCGKSYLCRLIDILNMGYVDEVIVGREVVDRVPDLLEIWLKELKTQSLKK